MNDEVVLFKTKRLLFWTPVMLILVIFLGGILGLAQMKTGNIVYTVGIVLCFIFGFFYPHYALGRAASLLGSSWVYFGFVPLLAVPVGALFSWLILIDKRSKLVKQVALKKLEQGEGLAVSAT